MNDFRSSTLPALLMLLGLALSATAQAEQEGAPKQERGPEQRKTPPKELVDVTQGLGGKQQRPASQAALFRTFAKIKGLSASYTENKYLSLLAVPLKSTGKLHFMQPGYLSRIVETPEKSKLTITKSELRMASKDSSGKNKEEVIDLRQSDRVRLFVTSLVQVFQGNEKALKKHYRIRYTPKQDDAHAWQLELKPLEKPLTQIMARLVLVGRDKAVTGIELHEPNGDRTITKIVKVDAERTFTKKEQLEIFGVAPKVKKDGDKAPRKASPRKAAGKQGAKAGR